MADLTQTVVVQLIVDDSQLEPAIDQLERTGAIDAKLANGFRQTTAEINKQAAAIKADAAATAPLKKNLEDINKITKNVSQSFMQGFQEGVIDTLKEAGVSVKEFTDALGTGATEVSAPTESLRQRLKNLTTQIAQLKLAGQDNTDQFRELVIEAGRVKDAMNDAGQEIKNIASDTGTFDGIISGLQGVTAVAQIGTGVTALFGEESEELQKTLLKVNAVMAIGQGLQQIQNVLQKESAASRLIDTIAAKAQIVVQRIYTAVTGQATAATVAFKVALASTGIGLLVIGVLALIQALNEEDDALERVNSELERNKALIDADIASIERRTDIAVAEAQKAGKVESDITKIRGRALLEQRAAIEQANKDLARQAEGLDKTTDAYIELNKRINENGDAVKDIDTKLIIENLNLQKQLADEAKKAAEEQKKLADERAAKAKAQRLLELNDQLAALQRQLLTVEEGGEQELRIKQRIVLAKSRIELEGENLTKNQRLLIQEQATREQIELERERNKKITAEAIAGQISLNNAVLAQIQTNADDRLLLQISNIELAAQAEINAAEGNANRIKEVIAKRDADIAAVRKANLEEQAQQEIDLLTANEGARNRSLQKIAQDERESARNRITAIQQLAEFEIENIETRERLLEEERQKRLIGEQEYNLRYAQLQDQKAQLSENTEKKITDIHAAEAEKRKQKDLETIEQVINVSQQVIGVLESINDLKTAQDEERLKGERARVQELLESGAITEKEAIARQKRLDIEEKRLRTQQAQREKQVAVFKAVLAIPQAYLTGLAQGGPIVGAIYAGIAAVQAALVIAKPIPKFRTGKKGNYEGPGIIGEAGSEIFEHDGKRYVAHKETLVWLGKQDKVYTPSETRQMLPSIDRQLMKQQAEGTGIDEEKFAERVGQAVAAAVKKIPQTNVSVDEYGFHVGIQTGLSRQNYRDKYYSSK